MYNFLGQIQIQKEQKTCGTAAFRLRILFQSSDLFSFSLCVFHTRLPSFIFAILHRFSTKKKNFFYKNQFEIYGGALNGFFRKTIPTKQDTHCKCDCCHFFFAYVVQTRFRAIFFFSSSSSCASLLHILLYHRFYLYRLF